MADKDIIIKAPPPKPNINDPAYQKLLAHEAKKDAIITAEIAAVARLVPGIPGKVLASLLIGFEKDIGEGKLSPTKQAATNFGPAPIGFSDPGAFGLKENYWLPPGSTNFIPAFFDALGLGIPQQRTEDERQVERERIARFRDAAKILTHETDETLANIVSDQGGPLTRASELRAVGPIKDLPALKVAAANEQLFRSFPELRIAINNSGWVPTEALPSNLKEIIRGSFDPLAIDPATLLAMASADKAEGIRKELVTERADP